MPSGSRIVIRAAAEADIPTPDTDQVAIFIDADASNTPAYKDDGGIVSSLVGTAGADGADAPPVTYNNHGNTGSTETLDFSVADIQRLVANAATVTLTYSNIPVTGTPGLCLAWLEQDATGGRVWAFPASTDWGDAGEPDWGSRAGLAVDLVSLLTVDGGTRVVAWLAGRPGPAGATGAAGTNGTNGTNGDFGGAIAIDYTFSTTTTDSDPGSGVLRLSNATQASATTIRADLNDSHGVDWSAVLATLGDSTNTVKGHIRLVKRSDLTKWLLFTVSAVASPSGYKNITVANVGSSGANPLTNSDAIVLLFTRAGDVGASGTASVGTDPIFDAKGDLPAGTGADSAATLTVGSNGQVLVADSTQSTGLKWAERGLLAISAYNPTATDTTISGTTQAEVDATNLKVTFTAPASGNVIVRIECKAYAEVAGARLSWGLRESSSDVIGPIEVLADGTAGPEIVISRTFYLTGVSAGSHTYKWAAKRASANCNMRYGGVYGQAIMEVWAAP